jgi:hypothetical protein
MGAAFCFLEFEDEKDAEVKIVSRGKIKNDGVISFKN